MLHKILAWMGRQEMSVGSWLAAFLSIYMIRFFIECLSSAPLADILDKTPPLILLQFALFYLALVLGVACILKLATRDAPSIIKIILYGTCLIWIAPSVDLAVYGRAGQVMMYIFAGSDEIWHRYLTAFGAQPALNAITAGIQVEVAVILFGIGLFAFLYRRNLWAPVIAVLAAHFFIFFIGCLPSLVAILLQSPTPETLTGNGFFDYFRSVYWESGMARNVMGAGDPAFTGTDMVFAQILLFVSAALGLLWFLLDRPKTVRAILRNCRPERALFYAAFLFVGLALANVQRGAWTYNWIDDLSIATLVLSWFASWMFAVHINDIADIEIDKISNRSRPLVTGALSVEEMRQSAVIWLAISFAGAMALGQYTLFLDAFCIACSYAYSAYPLRLKRVPVFASLLIALVALGSVFAGFFLMCTDKAQSSFPLAVALSFVAMFTLGVNVRDIKDIEGDRAQGIMTLPVLFGKNGTRVTGLLFAASFLVAPLVFQWMLAYAIAAPAAMAAYIVATHKSFHDRHVFVLYFVFVAAGLALMIVAPHYGYAQPGVLDLIRQ
ncbi:MAG: UbiA family prenyltransferase [Alphaproteobacteria bacterium]|nr:UbiA family prenyltransferase [Alphaproteobacteria bacterium]